MLIPLIGVFLSQSRSHCSPRLYPVAFDFIISFCLLVIQRLNDTREAFLEDLAPVTQVLMSLQLTKMVSRPPTSPLTDPRPIPRIVTHLRTRSSGKLGAPGQC